MTKSEVKRGQAISFRIPSDTPDHLLKQLQKLKETERRNFSSKIADFVMQGVGQSLRKEKEMVSIPLPHSLTKAQRNWLKHEHSEALLGSIVYQLLTDPGRAAALLATLNSSSVDLDEALYLQEELNVEEPPLEEELKDESESAPPSLEKPPSPPSDDDIDSFELDISKQDESEKVEEEEAPEEDLDSLLGDFLNEMNK